MITEPPRTRAMPIGEETLRTQERYDRQARSYDRHMGLVDRLGMGALRQRLWSRCPSGRILEIGVGTGRNFTYHPKGATVVGLDLSPEMLGLSRATAEDLGQSIRLLEIDVQSLAFRGASFDGAVGTFVFCSVPDPVQGLREVWRVLEPGASLFLLEHVRLPGLLGTVMDIFDPVVVRMAGAHINRSTVANVREAGFQVEEDLSYFGGLVRFVVARRPHLEPEKVQRQSDSLGDGL